ncbi:hypothetical protein [Chitinophaga sp. Cy-1792]|uniref:hypothetical protein n=1 Tax=Chitinophaga sp. Cy-1792 TaxID=2608339 RepID=UPI00142006FE|nr:hypothetical protein [Chitinophaga sp. Cy-1792]NIG52818.1 hypothetical protein [Chitinophaga sp. Cy-1792]
MRIQQLVIAALLVFSFVACRKGASPEEVYYGQVSYRSMALPGTPAISVKWNGQLMDSALTDSYKGFMKEASNTPGKLGFYKAGTDSLIVDTTITILPNTKQEFRIMASSTLGMSGFMPATTVSPDSLTFQIYLNLSTYYKYDVIDLQIASLKVPGNITTDFVLLKGLSNKKLYPITLTLPFKDATGKQYQWVGILKDPATGQVIPLPRTPYMFIFANVIYAGIYFATIADTNGTIKTTQTML